MFRRVVEHTEEGTPFRTRVLKRNVKSVRIGRISVLPSLLYSSSHWVSSQADVARAPPFLSVSRHAPSLSFSARYTHEGADAGRQKPCLDRSPLCPSFSFPLSSTSEIPLSLASERARLRSVAAAAGYYTPPRAHNHHQPQTTTTTTQLYARTLEKSNITDPRSDRTTDRPCWPESLVFVLERARAPPNERGHAAMRIRAGVEG